MAQLALVQQRIRFGDGAKHISHAEASTPTGSDSLTLDVITVSSAMGAVAAALFGVQGEVEDAVPDWRHLFVLGVAQPSVEYWVSEAWRISDRPGTYVRTRDV